MSATQVVTPAIASAGRRCPTAEPVSCGRHAPTRCASHQFISLRLFFASLTLVCVALAGCGKVGDDLVRQPDVLRTKLDRGLAADSRTESGDTLIVAAIRAENTASLDQLLAAGADPSLAEPGHRNAWYYAFTSADPAFLDALTRAGLVPPAVADADVPAVLEAMAKHGALRARLPILLSAPVRLDQSDADGRSPLAIVLDSTEPEAAELLLAAGATATGLPFASLAMLVQPGREGLLLSILAAGANVNAWGRQAEGQVPTDLNLMYAALDQENIAAVSLLLNAGFAPSAGGADSMALAIVKGYPGVAVELLHRGARPDRQVDGLSAVDAAELVADVLFMSELKLAPLEIDPTTARRIDLSLQELGFPAAATGGAINSDTLKAGIEVYQRRKGLAAHGHYSQQLDKLLEDDLQGALLMAAARGDTDRVARLYAFFDGIGSATDRSGRDVLMQASWHAQPAVVRWLVAHGHPVTNVDQGGSSALLLAVISPAALKEPKQETIRALIAAGADPKATNKDGVSALKFASDRGGTLAAIVGVGAG